MKRKIENGFIINYLIMFIISIIITCFAAMALGFANDVISKTLVKNNYTAKSLMRDNYKAIDTTSVLTNGGGVQVINTKYQVVFSAGLNTILKDKLTTSEFTNFLIKSKSKGIQYSYSIEYNAKKQFYLIVTFPTSIRIDFAIVHNKELTSVDTQGVIGVITAVILFYLMLLAIATVAYSKLTSLSIINPVKKLTESIKAIKAGDYTSRVDLNLKNEFGELEDLYNEMAEQIEKEISLRTQSEENRKRLILDVSHDLKNPLASIMGYSELCNSRTDLPEELSLYMKAIYNNSLRANTLIMDLFELSKVESSEFTINKTKVDICEYMRIKIGTFIPSFDEAGFSYDFNLPEEEILVEIDTKLIDRVFQNLVLNTVKYNPKGTVITISLTEKEAEVVIVFKDNGIGIPKELAKDIFNPFVRVDSARNSETGGTGLGLAIASKIINKHGGSIILETSEGYGCEFIITIPKI